MDALTKETTFKSGYNNAMTRFWSRFKQFFDPIDLTVGNPKKDILRFSLPIFLSTFFQSIYTLVDTIVCGQTLDEPSIAAVTNTTTIVFLFFQFAFGCSSGFSVVLSKRMGEKDMAGVRKSIATQWFLTAIIILILSVGGVFALPLLLQAIGIHPSDTDPAMAAEYQAAITYLTIIVGGLFSQLVYNLAVSCLRAYGDSFTPFLFLLLSTALNVGLDCLFLMVFHWGVAGAAWATVIAQALAGIASWIYFFVHNPVLRFHKEDWKIRWKDCYEHLRDGLPLAFNFSILSIGIIVMSGSIIAFDRRPDGTMDPQMPVQIGYGVACKLFNLFTGLQQSLGLAMMSYMAENLGAGNRKRIQEGFRFSFFFGFLLTVGINVVGLLLCIHGAYQYLFLHVEAITSKSIEAGNAYLYLALPTSMILMWLFLFRNELQGLEKPLFPFLAGIAELIARVLICLFLPSFINGGAVSTDSSVWALLGAYAGDPGAWLLASLTMVIPCIRAVYPKKTKELTSIK